MDKDADLVATAYLQRWFWPLDALAAAAGISGADARTLIKAGCAPGPIYARTAAGEYWSALAASCGTAPPNPPSGAAVWYSRSSAWDLRRAVLGLRAGLDPDQAASAGRAHYIASFLDALGWVDGAREAYAACWSQGELDLATATSVAEGEWGSWRDGSYGVCLRMVTARTCIAKESLGWRLKRRVGTVAADELLDDAQALAQLMLPFAPWERPAGTPGRTIDPLLEAARLGEELPYS